MDMGVGESWGFSNYFLANDSVDDNADMKSIFDPIIELTHNHGTESNPDFRF
jgi:hypothetical protein